MYTPKPVKWAPVYVGYLSIWATFAGTELSNGVLTRGEPVKWATCLCGLALAPHGNQVEPVYVGHRIDLEDFSILHYCLTTLPPRCLESNPNRHRYRKNHRSKMS